MKLENLATEPKLTKIILDDDWVVKEYDEPIEFWAYDKQPLEKFIRFANAQPGGEDFPKLLEFCKDLILDESGKPIIEGDKVLPTKIMMGCLNKVVLQLGK